jgi:hypothetical protein
MSPEILGFNTWTKNFPQQYLELYTDSAQKINLPLVAIVDDVLPEVIFNRSNEQSLEYNEAYRTTMLEMGFNRVEFASTLLPERSEDLTHLYQISSKVSLPGFLALLPERKREIEQTLTLSEVVDTCWQLSVLEAGMSCTGITRYLTGKRSTALFRYAKKVINGFEFDIVDES